MVVEVEPDLPHGHCDSCFNRNCQVSPQPGNACSLVNCDVDCGARFHRCKEEEHRLLCPNTKTECVNAIYGCPVNIQRRYICRHLETCPASVVNCTMEWNRWPVYASERQPQQPLQVVPDNLNQLDIALALRDQRMLTKSMKASKRTRQILTNALNRRHPAVPLSAQLTNTDASDIEEEQRELVSLLQVMQDEKEAADRERARTPPGLQRSICNELYRTTPVTNGTTAPAAEEQFYPLPKDPFIHCSHCARRKERLDRIVASKAAMLDPYNGALAAEDDTSLVDYALTPLPEHQNGFSQEGEGCPNGLYHHEGREDGVYQDGMQEADRPGSLDSTFSSEDSDIHTPAVFVTQSTTGDVSAAPTRGHSKPIIIQPPAQSSVANKTHRLSSSSNGSLDSRHSLSLDLSLESITRYQAKPDSMYTFLCAQEFRRDEYPYHFQNVHSDIHGGLNGWMEQRCPLAPYGCTFSQRRLYPGSHGAHIIHSENLESFGLCLDAEHEKSADVSGCCAHSAYTEDLEASRTCLSSSGKTSEGEREEETTKFPKFAAEVMPETSSHESSDARHDDNLKTNGDVCTHNDSNNENFKITNSIESQCNALDDAENQSKRPKDVSMKPEDSTNRGCDVECSSKIEFDQSRDETTSSLEKQPEKSSTGESLKDTLQIEGAIHAEAEDSGVDRLSQLPFELLRYLLRFLDSFTINHLAMSSKLLRQVCCSLLEERGMVVLQWEKRRGHWDTTMKVWHFSTAFTPVKSWGFQDNPPIAEHLKRCPFNVRNMSTQPVKVMGHEAPKVKLESATEDPQKVLEAEATQAWRPRYRRLRDCDDDW